MRKRVLLAVLAGMMVLGTVATTGGPAAAGTTQREVAGAKLLGVNEVPGPGDPDGKGTAIIGLVPGKGKVCWVINVTGITLPATAAHIHHAPPGIAGPIVVTLSPPDSSGHVHGCQTGVDQTLIDDIIANTSDYYVNVHTTDFPGGAIRGQLRLFR